MKREAMKVILIAFCMFVFAGCGHENEEGDDRKDSITVDSDMVEEALIPTGEYVPVAQFAALPMGSGGGIMGEGDCLYWNNEIIYLQMEYIPAENGESGGRNESRLMAVAADGKGLPRVVAESKDDGSYICQFFSDRENNLYLYETKGFVYDENNTRHGLYYLRKINADGQELYRADVSEAMGDTYWPSIKGYADEEGNVALIQIGGENGLYFFDSQGQYYGSAALEDNVIDRHHNANNIVRAGEQEYYLWSVQFSGNVSLRRVDFQKGAVSDEIMINLSSLAAASSMQDYVLFDGRDKGLLVSTRNSLWQYDLKTGESAEIFRWDENNINVDGRYVAQIKWGAASERGIPMDIIFYDDFSLMGYEYIDPMAAGIRYEDRAYLVNPEKVYIGLDNNNGNIERLVRRFNRFHKEYEAVLADYSASELKEMLMYGREVPDLLDITGIRMEWLETKGLLEDLVPYFERSRKVSKEDILPEIWNLLCRNGKLPGIATSFTLQSMITTVDVPENGWSYNEFLELQNKYPDSLYYEQFSPMRVWGTISATVLDEFIDWKQQKCNFDNEEFRELLKKINHLNYPKRQGQISVDAGERMEKLMNGQVLLQVAYYGSPFDYDKEQSDSNRAIRSVGYPTADGEPKFLFSASQLLGIYAESVHKDGAWAFLEFLLSENEQEWYGSEKDVFPVRESAFEKYLTKSYRSINVISDVETLEDTPDKLRYMVEHLGINQNNDDIGRIFSEELQAYFAGDKTVDETVKVIQNRVQLFLNEM